MMSFEMNLQGRARGRGYRGSQPKSWLFLLFLFLCTIPMAFGQVTTGDILGTVTDATGAVIPNATVTVVNTGTHETRNVTSNASGEYLVSTLPVGHYSVTVKAPGFKATTTNNLSLEAGDRARTDVKLELGGETETVNVEAETPLLQADNATVSSTVDAKSVQDLPLNGRNFVQLVQIVPGANEGPGNGLTSGGRPDDRRSTNGFSVNGQDSTLNNYIIDGIDDNERVIGTIGVKPNVEGIQEITVETNSYSAEAGRTAGGVVNLVTRSGTNQFHGTAYEFFRNDVFDARNVFQTTGRKPELRQNQYGGSLGGPIFKDKTFFYGDYEGYRQVSGLTYESTVPTIDEYNDIHSLNGGTPQTLINEGEGTAGLPVDPIALAYLQLFPAPTNSALTSNYVVSPNRTQNSTTFDGRIDHHFNNNNLLFGRYTYNKVDTLTPQALGTQNGLQISGGRYIFAGPATDIAQQAEFGFTHVFNQNLLLDLRAAYTYINNLSLPLNYGLNADTKVGFGSNMNFNATANELTPISFGPFSDIGDGAYVPLQDVDNTFQYAGTLSYTRGNHNIKFGLSLLRRQARNLQSAFPSGQYGFGLGTDACAPGTTYNAAANQCNTPASNGPLGAEQQQNNNLASSLVGAFSSDSRNYDLDTPNYRSWEPSGFILDSWKATPNLTVLYGVRYDVFTPFTETRGAISNFDFNSALGDTQANIATALKVPGQNGVGPHAGIYTDYSNLAPRIGFSLSVRPTTVLRGGYGMSFFPGNYTSNADLKNAPFVSVFSPNCQSALAIQIQQSLGQTLANIGGNGACGGPNAPTAPATFDAGLPLPAPQSISSPSLSFDAEDPHFCSALIQQYNLQVEQQFGANVLTVGYVGNTAQHLPETINNINVPQPFNPAVTTATLPLIGVLPNLSGVSWLQSEGISNYNALQMSFQRRFTKGLAFDANYTYAKALSDITGFSEEGDQGWSNANPYRINTIDYGEAENDIHHRVAFSANYELQYGKDFTGVKKFVLHGWQANTIVVWQTGKPFTVLNGGGNYDGTYSNRATPYDNGGPDRPNQIANPNLGHKTLSHFFNTAAFCGAPYAAGANQQNPTASCSVAQSQALGTVGTEQRNDLFGPHFRHFDLSLFKDFPLTERVNLQFRAEAFDVTNTPDFFMPNTGSSDAQLGSSSFGQITNYDPNYNPRQLQFALKVQF